MQDGFIRFSLVMATYGREKEIEEFLESILVQQQFDLNELEIIIVDQNDIINLDKLCDLYSNKLNIIHIKSNKKGLSLNRNIGLKIARGQYIAFPDDDCRYYSDTLYQVKNYFDKNKDISLVLGRIIERSSEKNIIRSWKNYNYSVNLTNFFTSFSSITIFSKRKDIYFDETLGVGTFFGSCEDADYIWQILNCRDKIVYTPDIDVWHPEPEEKEINYNKVYSYGLGFGALIYKHMSIPAIRLFMKSIGYHFINLILNLIKLNKSGSKKSWLSLTSRFKGIYLYANK
ncbi:glycosyltransferase [Actinobacillus pleuropneumoniae]|uniref:Putative glycosyltransferase n=2 Tax=Actinobacillus pleuropneumoniae TaxID=715 RepID=A0A897Q6D7_ACTPL|nr:glycosyltransferase family 2 protein [Actinobacillus pleuropneumoniae]QSG30281.1 putative glycosyltransferase [Actinobacillus pleuropneumoniae serovar 19]MCY6395923.1 glycosyltransferase family 2 protein [Actinobacillus pleuropneumoniae]MCY6409723.1 glycosyltransferase family 2 protein [Actinobacillus pleuropneumoniae]MCY6429754.1 glycosyltransferase family 2 protein [Actinobacillus pleuropneumoniae]UKH41683.1 glycosyltransferase [Actinobacillus pleuropneumoniae serovar 4 str. M62]